MASYLLLLSVVSLHVPIPMYLNYTLNLALFVARVQVYTIKKDVLRFFGQPVQVLNLLYSNTGKIFPFR